MNNDHRVDGSDISAFVGCVLGACGPNGCYWSDMNRDGMIDPTDVSLLVVRLMSAESTACAQ